MRPMQRRIQEVPAPSGGDVTSLFTRTMAGYLLLMGGLWLVGLESIYGHPTPFYALFSPALTSFADLRWQIPTLIVAGTGLLVLRRFLFPVLLSPDERSRKEALWLLGGVFLFAVFFAAAIAMIRDGWWGIEQAYNRQTYEYIGDIGKTRNIQQLFERYTDDNLFPYLSMHAKVHPPGPIALLWFLSYFVGNSPFSLSVATIVVSSLAIFPLYGWARMITNQRTAFIACVCYSLVPSIVLFTATSADALFTPFTLTTLYCFERAIRHCSTRFGLLAGIGYGVMTLLKFSLIGMGAYFGLVGLWMLRNPETRRNVFQTALLMVLGLLSVIGAVYWWSGFNIYETFLMAKQQFDQDQAHLDILSPRLPAWTYRILNPACWFFFAGIPVSVLAIREFFRGDPTLRHRWWIFALMLIVLNLLYLARGEGERSALYLFPFLVIPAAHYLGRGIAQQQHTGPLLATVSFLLFQCWFIESFFYTYW